VAGAVGAVVLLGLLIWLLSGEKRTGRRPALPSPNVEGANVEGAKEGPAKEKEGAKQELPPPGNLPREVVNSIGMKLVLVRSGKFKMGSHRSEPSNRPEELPQHEVEITRPFYLGAYEVTQREYEKVTGKSPARYHAGNSGGPDHPVECVSWEGAR
jgi:formylglycine-generating enzyme required for sulfatase activity